MNQAVEAGSTSSHIGSCTNGVQRCVHDHRRMTISSAVITIIICLVLIGLLVNELMILADYIHFHSKDLHLLNDRHKRQSHDIPENETISQSDQNDGISLKQVINSHPPVVVTHHTPTHNVTGGHSLTIHQASINKVLYTALICDLVLLILTSLALLKGLSLKKQSPILTWLIVIAVTVIYAGVVVIREVILLPDSPRAIAKLVMLVLFATLESTFAKPATDAYKEFRRLSRLRLRGAHLDFPASMRRDRGARVSSVSGLNVEDYHEPVIPDDFFKLPTYDEAMREPGEAPPYEQITLDSLDAQVGIPWNSEPPAYEPPTPACEETAH